MARIEARLESMGIVLPPPLKLPPGMVIPFSFVVVRGTTAYIAGHAAQNPDGSIAGPLGKVGTEVSPEQAADLAKGVAVSILASLKRKLGDLDRITGWNKALGMVNVAPGFAATTGVINGFSNFILEVFGPEAGEHTRSAVGVAVLPMNIAVEIEAEVDIRP
jgi:enamine deaminase RidA (YjgF/YER057c/UK114 family)